MQERKGCLKREKKGKEGKIRNRGLTLKKISTYGSIYYYYYYYYNYYYYYYFYYYFYYYCYYYYHY